MPPISHKSIITFNNANFNPYHNSQLAHVLSSQQVPYQACGQDFFFVNDYHATNIHAIYSPPLIPLHIEELAQENLCMVKLMPNGGLRKFAK